MPGRICRPLAALPSPSATATGQMPAGQHRHVAEVRIGRQMNGVRSLPRPTGRRRARDGRGGRFTRMPSGSMDGTRPVGRKPHDGARGRRPRRVPLMFGMAWLVTSGGFGELLRTVSLDEALRSGGRAGPDHPRQAAIARPLRRHVRLQPTPRLGPLHAGFDVDIRPAFLVRIAGGAAILVGCRGEIEIAVVRTRTVGRGLDRAEIATHGLRRAPADIDRLRALFVMHIAVKMAGRIDDADVSADALRRRCRSTAPRAENLLPVRAACTTLPMTVRLFVA